MVGVDEVGRGCLAGPLLVVAARARTNLPPGLRDSKLLSRAQREILYPLLVETCEFGQGWVRASEIDSLGLARSLKLGVRRALAALEALADEEIVIDGSVNYVPRKFKNSRCEIDADNSLPLVSAASVFAKVTRDKFMAELAKKHPRYHFENHVGYGTKEHYRAIELYGTLRFVHRVSFAPFRQASLL